MRKLMYHLWEGGREGGRKEGREREREGGRNQGRLMGAGDGGRKDKGGKGILEAEGGRKNCY